MEYKRFLGPVQIMHAQNKMFEHLTVAQATGRKICSKIKETTECSWKRWNRVLLLKENYSIGQT